MNALEPPVHVDLPLALWTIVRPGSLVLLFGAGWAVNVWVFTRFRLDYISVLGLSMEELVRPKRLLTCSLLGITLWTSLCVALTVHSDVLGLRALSGMLLAYVMAVTALYAWLPLPFSRPLRWRVALGRSLWRCLQPVPNREVPFIEVLVADGLTSLSKAFFDLGVGSCVVLKAAGALSLSVSQQAAVVVKDVGIISAHVAAAQNGPLSPSDAMIAARTALAASSAERGTNQSIMHPAGHLASFLRSTDTASSATSDGSAPGFVSDLHAQCEQSPMPFLLWSLPFLIRARQCVISSRNVQDTTGKALQLVNLAKYLSAVPVIVFSFMYARSASSESAGGFEREDFEALWAVSAMVNAVYSLMWDMVMDWGLLQAPGECTSDSTGVRGLSVLGLRPVLVFRHVWGFYHGVILLNLGGRTLWSLRWSQQATELLGSFYLSSLQQVAEVLRRCMWNLVRVEWECIRRGMTRADKQFEV